MTDRQSLLFTASDLSETDRLATALARHLPDGTTVALIGPLAAGKTRLVQAVAEACGVPAGMVTSPTFVLCQHYQARRAIHHLDVYRLNDSDEFLELGVEELFESAALVFVEWGDRFPECLPDQRLEIRIDVTGSNTRQFQLSASADLAASLSSIRSDLANA